MSNLVTGLAIGFCGVIIFFGVISIVIAIKDAIKRRIRRWRYNKPPDEPEETQEPETQPEPMFTPEKTATELQDMTKAQIIALMDIAGIRHTTKMTKAQLIEAFLAGPDKGED